MNNHSDSYTYEQQQFKIANPSTVPNAYIQWKGTSVCLDVHCSCGYHSHIDDEFCYYVQCPKCDLIYAVSNIVALIPVQGEHLDYVKKNCDGVIKKDESYDGEQV